MGQEIVYCVSCQTQLRGSDFEKGQAFKVGNESFCKKCVPEAIKSLPPHKAQALQTTLPPPTTPRTGTARIPLATPPVRSPAAGNSGGVLLALGGGAVVFMIIAYFSLTSGKPPAPGSPGPPSQRIPVAPTVTAPVGPRDSAALNALKEALRFAEAHPSDLMGQIHLLEEAAALAKGSDVEAETKHALERARKRSGEVVTQELLALDQKVRAACAREEFKTALVLIEDARKRSLSSEWGGELDGRVLEVQARADAAFALVKEQAIRANPEELKSLKGRVAKWGLERLDLEGALARATPKTEPPPTKPAEPAPTEKPAEPIPAPPAPPLPPPIPPAPGLPRRPPVPEVAKQREAEARVRKTFNLDLAKTTKDKADLGRTLLQTASSSGAKDVEFYVFLRLARDLAAQALDSKTALASIEVMALAFDLESGREKASLLTKTPIPRGSDPLPWARACLELVEQAVKAEEYDDALKLSERAETLARGANERPLADGAKQRSKELTDLKREAERAKPFLKQLETKPDDAEANAAVGRFLCLFKEEWDRGLPMLAKASDPALRKLAEQELLKPSEAVAQAMLGEGWAAQAEKESANSKPRMRGRAAMWLERAIPGLTGVAKVSAERKLASLGPPASGRDRQVGITFQSAEQIRMFVTSGGNWRVENNELVGTCSGEDQWATYNTSYSAINQVTLRARIIPPGQHNLRLWVGPIHVIFNWNGADRDSYRNGKALTDKPNTAIKPGKEYEISIKQQGSKVVVAIDGTPQWETEATLTGTISLQAALDSTIGLRQLTIEGTPDFTKTVSPENRMIP